MLHLCGGTRSQLESACMGLTSATNLLASRSCTPPAASRSKAIRDFQTDPPTKVFLITHRCGGLVLASDICRPYG